MFALLLLASAAFAKYTVTATRANREKPLFSSPDHSAFSYSYNPAYVPASESWKQGGLIVRCQMNTSDSTGDPYSAGPSVLAYSKQLGQLDPDNLLFADLTFADIVLQPDGPEEAFGDEDPRIVYRPKDDSYYLLYSAVNNIAELQSMLALATSSSPGVNGTWERQGDLFPSQDWTKSGALLIRDDVGPPHYLFYGDNKGGLGIQMATSTDPALKTWTNHGPWIQTRSDSFDSELVEGGPFPLRLSNGDYLFIYNSARRGYPSPKPGYELQYNPSWVVLDGNDPSHILERASEPLMSPELDWEKHGLTPNVVFIEGAVPIGTDTFLVFYGAADSYVGAAVVKVKIDE